MVEKIKALFIELGELVGNIVDVVIKIKDLFNKDSKDNDKIENKTEK